MLLESALETWRAGGFVMPPLAVATLVLWWTLGMRFARLRRGSSGTLRSLLVQAEAGSLEPSGVVDGALVEGVALAKAHPAQVRPRVQWMIQGLREELSRGSRTIAILVGVAPLAGLLGTVTGMIETFDFLATMTLFSRSGGIAGGVSQALVSTQAGLVVAVPGVIAGRLLAMKQERLEVEIDEVEELLSARFGHEEAA
ncbi:MAG: MotA/TolQ/ExbB proton channel family protein [Myxococcota bacterium]|nr:MotA/TolQ/ExbB proton channel family protein [Myxococcota bacterium]